MYRLPPELDDRLFALPAPVRVAGPAEAHRASYVPLDAVATAAALPFRCRRILLLAADQWLGWGYPVWSLAGVTDWSKADVIAIGRRLAGLGLAELQDNDGSLWIKPTGAGRAAATLILSWRS